MKIEKEIDRWRKNTPVEENGFFEAVEIRRAVGTSLEMCPDSFKVPPVKRAEILRNDFHRFSAPHDLSSLVPNASGAGLGFLLG